MNIIIVQQSTSRKACGPNRSVGLFKYKESHGRLKLKFLATGEIVGDLSSKWSRELTRIIKTKAPVDVSGWASIDNTRKLEIFKLMEVRSIKLIFV